LFTGTIGMVFGGLLGLGAARSLWTPGILPIDGWSFLSAGVTLFLLLPSAWRISRFLFGGLAEIGITLTILGLGMIGVFDITTTLTITPYRNTTYKYSWRTLPE
jgi:hypothetical protein